MSCSSVFSVPPPQEAPPPTTSFNPIFLQRRSCRLTGVFRFGRLGMGFFIPFDPNVLVIGFWLGLIKFHVFFCPSTRCFARSATPWFSPFMFREIIGEGGRSFGESPPPHALVHPFPTDLSQALRSACSLGDIGPLSYFFLVFVETGFVTFTLE